MSVSECESESESERVRVRSFYLEEILQYTQSFYIAISAKIICKKYVPY